MRDGYDADDACIMVEDEFLTTAKLYTSHLHHAEYQKLERLSLSQNEGAIKKLERPTDERTQMSIETRKKLEASKQRARSRVAFANVYGNDEEEDEDEDDPWLRDPRLAGLMRPKDIAAPLGNIAGIGSVKTRASEGYLESRKVPVTRAFDLANIGRSSSPEDEAPVRHVQPPPATISEDDNDDDSLDRPLHPISALPESEDDMDLDAGSQYIYSKPTTLRSHFGAPRQEPEPSRHPLDKPKPRPKSLNSRSKPFEPSSDSPGPDHDFDLLPLRRYHPNRPNALSRSLRGRSKKKDDEKKRTLKVEDVPTFLF